MVQLNNTKLVKIVEESIDEFLENFKEKPWIYSEADMQCELYRILHSKITNGGIRLWKNTKIGWLQLLGAEGSVELREKTKLGFKGKKLHERRYDLYLDGEYITKKPIYLGIELKYDVYSSSKKEIINDIKKLLRGGVQKGYMITVCRNWELRNYKIDPFKQRNRNLDNALSLAIKEVGPKAKKVTVKIYYLMIDKKNDKEMDIRWVCKDGTCKKILTKGKHLMK